MGEALGVQERAVQNQRTAVDVFLNQFQQGLVAFTTVVQAELTLLNDEQSALTIRQNLFVASVSLIEALGGGWDTTLLPTQVKLMEGFSLLPQLDSTPPGQPVTADAPQQQPESAPQRIK